MAPPVWGGAAVAEAAMDGLDRMPAGVAALAALTLGLAPFVPEPHLWAKLKMLAAGTLVRPLDIFGLLLQAAPRLVLAARLGRIAAAR